MSVQTISTRDALENRELWRIDGFDRVSGRAKYCADWKLPRTLYASVILSTIPHGIVRSVDVSDALTNPEIKEVITCKTDRSIWNAGEREHLRRVFTEHVRFVGDCIGAIAATSRTAAREAVDRVKVEYDELPSVFSVDDAQRTSAKIWEDRDFIGPLSYGFGEAEREFQSEEATLLLDAEYFTSRVHNSPLEPAVSLAFWEGDHLTVVAATQGIFGCREGLSRDLGIPQEDIRVISFYKGGGFGNKNSSMNYDVIASLLARRTRNPVMIEYSREEEFVGVHGRWSSKQRLRGAFNSNAKLIALDLTAFCDIGAYTRHIKAGRFVEGPENYYSCSAWRGTAYGVYTNTPATAHMRAPTGPQSCFAAECFLDEAAFKLGVNPLEIRLRNAADKYQNSKVFTTNYLKECLSLGAESFGWERRWKPPPSGTLGKEEVTGVGVSMASWHARLGKGEAVVTLKRDGTVIVAVGVVDIGTGAKSAMALIASRVLKTPVQNVKVVWGDTSLCPFSIGESGSRTTSFTGNAVAEASLRIRKKLLSLASTHLGLSPELLELGSGFVRHKLRSETKIGFGELLGEELSEHALTEPVIPEGQERFAFAAHYAEVKVDVETGEVAVTDYLAAHESGTIVNYLTARSQVQGGVVMGMGMALSERLLIDPNYGSILNPNFYAYRLPNIKSIPKIRVEFIDSKDPFGTKSLGEIPIVPVAAALGNAIFNATGVRMRKLPFSQEKLSDEISTRRAF